MRDLPPPILELTFEQKFEMAKLLRNIEEADKETVVQCCAELIHHNFILKSTIGNLVRHWNSPGPQLEGADPTEELPDLS